VAERRRAKRYRMGTSVVFYWEGPDNQRFQGEGITRDMSVAGIFVLSATCPPANVVVRMKVHFPPWVAASKALMEAEMTVLRVDHDIADDKRSGFSAVSNGFSLRTFSIQESRLVADLIKGVGDIVEGPEDQRESTN
jgi:hypothetical protein